MKIITLPGGTERIVHIVAKALMANKESNAGLPVIAVRPATNPYRFIMVEHAEILGPCTLRHTPEDPVPGTDGRAICVLRTIAPVKIRIKD